MSNERIKSALSAAKRGIRLKINEFDDDASNIRQQLRYHQGRVKHYNTSLSDINRKKRILRRELKKVEAVEYDLNPAKNFHKSKEVSKNA